MIDPNAIKFEPESHQYSIYSQTAGRWAPMPSVTGILAATGFVDSSFFTEHSRQRGTLVHRIIHWHVTGELDPSTIDPSLQGYFDAWRLFEAETGFVSTTTEQPMGSSQHRFCGTPDHIGTLNKQEAVVDCKTGAIYPHVGLQLAGYEILYGKPLKRFALALKENGKYSLKEFKDRQDRQIFLAALACYQWQRNQRRAA